MRRNLFLMVVGLCFIFSLFLVNESFAQKWKIPFIIKNQTNQGFLDMQRAAKQVAEKEGVELLAMAPIKPDNVEEQIRMIEDLIQKKVSAIIIVPADSLGIVPAIEKANNAGIPVIAANTRAFGGKVETFVAVENYEAALLQAEYMVKDLGGKGDIIIIEGVAASQTGQDRLRAYQDTLKKYPQIKVLASQTAHFRRETGMQVMENLLQRFPKIEAVLSANDSMSLGAIEAIDAAGRTSIKIYSFDCHRDALKAIKAGKLTITTDQNLWDQGRLSMEAAIKILKGEKIPSRIKTEPSIVNKDNVDKFIAKYGL